MIRLLDTLRRLRHYIFGDPLADIDVAAVDHCADIDSRNKGPLRVEEYIQYLQRDSEPKTLERLKWAVAQSDLSIVPSWMTLGDYAAYVAKRDKKA